MEQWTGPKLEKQYVKVVCSYLAYLTYMQSEHHVRCQTGWSTSWNQIARRNINNLRYADGITLMAESEEELKSLLMKVKEESVKLGLKFNS